MNTSIFLEREHLEKVESVSPVKYSCKIKNGSVYCGTDGRMMGGWKCAADLTITEKEDK